MSFTQKKNTPANAALAAELERLEPYFTHENQPYIRVPYSSRGAILSALRSSSPTATGEVGGIIDRLRSCLGRDGVELLRIEDAAAMLETLSRERDEAVRDAKQWEENHEALQDKFDCNKTCGCVYDDAYALCGYHSPRVIAAEARATTAETALALAVDLMRQRMCPSDGAMTTGQCIDSGRCGCSAGLVALGAVKT